MIVAERLGEASPGVVRVLLPLAVVKLMRPRAIGFGVRLVAGFLDKLPELRKRHFMAAEIIRAGQFYLVVVCHAEVAGRNERKLHTERIRIDDRALEGLRPLSLESGGLTAKQGQLRQCGPSVGR